MAGSSGAVQLPLRLTLPDDATLENFLPDDRTASLCAALRADFSEPLLFLHGPRGTGKTHLLQAACQRSDGRALYLPLGELRALEAAPLLQDLEGQQRVAIDQLEAVAGDRDWEEALFHFINRCRSGGCQLLFASLQPPAALPLALADLQSRLCGGLTWALPAPDEDGLRRILAFRAQRRGLVISDPVLDYLCSRASRSLPALLDLLQRLDEASLQAKRPLTVPLVRETLGW